MAKRKVNKSKKIREYMAAHPDEGPTQVATALSRFGITPAHVSNVKAREGTNAAPKRRKKRRATGKRSRRRSTTAGRRTTEAEPLVAAAELIRLCGGVDEAKAALDTAGQIASVLK